MIIKQLRGHSAIVRYERDGDTRAVYINRSQLPGSNHKVGDQIDIPMAIIDTGIAFGLEFAAFLPEFTCVSAKEIQNAFRQSDIWTLEDLKTKPQAATAVLQRIFGLIYGRILKAARRIEIE